MSILYVGTGVGGGGSSIGQANTANALGGSGGSINASQVQQEALYQKYQQYQAAQAAQAVPNVLAQPFNKDDAAWEASISTLVDVWLAKYGSDWVNEVELIDDKFFAIAATRLLKLNRLERINIPTSMHAVYRIVE